MLYIVASVFIFTLVNALIKDTASRYPITQVIFFRFFFALIPTAWLLYRAEGAKGFQFKAPVFQLNRALFGTVGLGFLFYSFANMPLADSIAISFSVSLFSTLVAIPILKEKPTKNHLLAVVIGFTGVLFIAKPSGHLLNIVALFCVLGAFIDSITLTTGRLLTLRSVSSEQISFGHSVVAAAASGIMMLFWGVMPHFQDFLLLTLMGLGGGFGQYFMTKGFSFAPAAVAAPMIYTAMIWSIIIGYLFWSEIPVFSSIIGMTIIIMSGLYIAYLESKRTSTD